MTEDAADELAPASADEPAPTIADAPGGRALAIAGAITLATAGVLTFAFDPERSGAWSMLAAIGVYYALLAALAVARLSARHEIATWMRPRSGDLTLGAVVAALLYGGAMAAHLSLSPHGSPREAWIIRIYLQLGDPDAVQMHLVAGAALVVAALEEIVWRGLVLPVLEDAFGTRRAWLWTTALFALAHAPVAYLLRDPVAGLNPMLPLAALGCGFVWGYLACRFGRLPPAIVAHALFTWALLEFPLWRAWER